MADDDYTHDPAWMDGYTGNQEAYEDHLAWLGLTPGTRPCSDETEPDGEVCTGTLTFALGDKQAQCPDCGGWMGRLAPGYDRQFTVTGSNAAERAAEAD